MVANCCLSCAIMDALKALIRARLHSSPLFAKIHEERPELREDTAGLLRVLEEQGLIDEFYASLSEELHAQPPWRPPPSPPLVAGPLPKPQQPPAALAVPSARPAPAGGNGRQLCLRLLQGRAFLDFLHQDGGAAGRDLHWQIAFGRHRARSRAVAATVDPFFDETIYLELPSMPQSSLLLHAVPIHMVLVCRNDPGSDEDPWDTGQVMVVCSHFLEWRGCLGASTPHKLTIELHGVGRRHQLAVGVLHAELELLPAIPVAEVLPDLSIHAQLRAEEEHRSRVMRRVFEDLDKWWASYHQLYAGRHIRLFAQTENRMFLPVTSFVTPLEAGRVLDSPLHALRWAGLIGTEEAVAQESTEPCWHTLPMIWAKRRSTIEEKTLLLCSVLLGYSMDAWCCLGSDCVGSAHAWVIVRDAEDASTNTDVTCWDVRSGARTRVDDVQFLTAYSSVDVVFNHRRLLVCHAQAAAHVAFDFSDPRCWLQVPLDDEALAALRLYPERHRPPFSDLRLQAWTLPADPGIMEEAIERRLAEAVRRHRQAAGFATAFDEHLSQLLRVALVNCEQERVGGDGAAAHGALFESLVRRVCGHDEVFRAVPVQFNHLRVSLYWPALIDRVAVREVLASRAHSALALHVRILPYPEGAVAIWVILAVRGRF